MMSAPCTPLPGKEFVRTVADRRATGRALRKEVPRSSHAEWSPVAERPDPISLLEEQNLFRQAQLVPIRYGRMAASPFGFLRGAAVVMAQDLAGTPVTGLEVQVCGDAHLSNFGVYATPERDQVFDVNDFDETLLGPWEWDVKRLAASVVVAARQNGLPARSTRQAVLHCLHTYRERMWAFAQMGHLDLWYQSVDAQSILKQVGRANRLFVTRELEKAYRHTNAKVFPQLTSNDHGKITIKDNPPLITHLDGAARADLTRALLEGYEASLPDER